jgi:hypothetical protein
VIPAAQSLNDYLGALAWRMAACKRPPKLLRLVSECFAER